MADFGDARLPERFWSKVEVNAETGCWEWTASTSNGYGKIATGFGRPPAWAHRFSHEALVGPIPEGLQIDHLCCVRRCVNPAHLEPVTHEENTRRAHQRPTCHRGHPRVEGERTCKACSREREKARWQKTVEARASGQATVGRAG